MTTGKYLTFALDKEEYAVPVLRVREIIKIMDITRVPQLPAYVKGVINLRGKVVPIVDMRMKFGLPAREYSERTCIIVVEVAVRNSVVMMGVIVDSVSDVLTISTDELAAPPDFGGSKEGGWVEALAKVKGHVKILLNLDKMLGADSDLIRAA
jgi:purine-binding chemotaxis protein CheW